MNELSDTSRRRFVVGLAAACGGIVSAECLAGHWPSYKRSANTKPSAGKVLNLNQMQLLRALADVIIPATETPGAAEVDAHGFIDDQLSCCHSPEDRDRAIRSLDAIAEIVKGSHSKAYWQLALHDQQALMTQMMNGAAPFSPEFRQIFRQLKSLTLFAYYTSEIGASKELNYLAIPGGYDGDFNVADAGNKCWAT